MARRETIADQLVRGLIARGWIEVQSNTRKARTFKHPDRRQGTPYRFVGKAGSLRLGHTYSGSIAASDKYRQQVLDSARLTDGNERQ